MTSQIGSIAALHRYPIKSLRGEAISESWASERGLLGDRALAVVDVETRKIASAKHPRLWRSLLQCQASYAEPPERGRALPPVRIVLPDGTRCSSDEPAAPGLLSDLLGRRVELSRESRPTEGYDDYWPDIEHLSPEGYRDTVTVEPISRLAPEGTFFDFSAFHLVTTQSLDALRAAAPDSRIELARFRPNFELTCADEPASFIENTWSGRTLRIGTDGVAIKLILPAMRCVMTNLAQADLPDDPRVLRAIVQANRIEIPRLGQYPCLGLYAGLARKLSAGGMIRRGDACELD
jgi:uncharacterized protein YcbX